MRTATLLLMVTGCPSSPDSASTDTATAVDWQAWDIEVSGPFSVGHITIEHTYVAFAGDEPRTIPIDIWYPTADSTGEDATYVYGVDEEAFENATPAPAVHEHGYPIHMHSHGFQGWGATSAFLMRHFASHGWIAVAPNHVGNLLADHEDPLYTAHYIHKLRDLQESLDVLVQAEWPSALHSDAVLLSGHSFGASYSTWGGAGAHFDAVEETCNSNAMPAGGCTATELEAFTSGTLSDDRIAAIIPMAGTIRESFFGPTGYEAVAQPVLFLSGSEDGPDSAQNHWDTTPNANMLWVELAGGCHQTFALGQCSTLDVPLGYTIVQSYALAFGRQHILADESHQDLLNATDVPWAEVTAQSR